MTAVADVERDELTALVDGVRSGDRDAWDALVRRYGPLVWSIVRAYRLTRPEAEDVFQTVWLRLITQLDRLREPAALPAWLATTARREATQALRRRAVAPDADVPEEAADTGPAPDERLLTDERNAMLYRAYDRLPRRCQTLLSLLVTDPAPSYGEVSAALDMPVGSIGPTRARCLAHLRRLLAEDADATETELLAALRDGDVGVRRVPPGVVDDAAGALTARPDGPAGGPAP